MSLTISYAIKELSKIQNNDITDIGKALSKGSLMGARGNSGVILSQIIRGIAKSIEGKEKLSSEDLAKAFKNSFCASILPRSPVTYPDRYRKNSTALLPLRVCFPALNKIERFWDGSE